MTHFTIYIAKQGEAFIFELERSVRLDWMSNLCVECRIELFDTVADELSDVRSSPVKCKLIFSGYIDNVNDKYSFEPGLKELEKQLENLGFELYQEIVSVIKKGKF